MVLHITRYTLHLYRVYVDIDMATSYIHTKMLTLLYIRTSIKFIYSFIYVLSLRVIRHLINVSYNNTQDVNITLPFVGVGVGDNIGEVSLEGGGSVGSLILVIA